MCIAERVYYPVEPQVRQCIGISDSMKSFFRINNGNNIKGDGLNP